MGSIRKGSIRNSFLIALIIGAALSSTAKAEIYITLVNQSAWTLYEVYMTSSDYEYWGDDLLETSGEVVLINGESVNIEVPSPGLWDLKIVDEDGDECIVTEIPIVADEYVELTSAMLLGCYG